MWQNIRRWVGLSALLVVMAPEVTRAATLAELADWCAPETGRERLCSSYLETVLQGLASTDPVMNGGNRMCVPPDTDRAEIIRLVRAYAAKSRAANATTALDGVGAALKGRFPCR